MFLVGDIGGTKTILAWSKMTTDGVELLSQMRFSSTESTNLETLVQTFLDTHPLDGDSLQGACFGIAGPIKNNHCKTTNIPWVVDGSALSKYLGGVDVTLLNDLEALAYGVEGLEEGDLLTLNEGIACPGNRAVIAAGTGLGQAILFWDGQGFQVSPSEGGHCDFAPRTSIQIDLLNHLSRRYGHVSAERVVSGMGLVGIFEYLGKKGLPADPDVAQAVKNGEGAAPISEAAAKGTCPRSAQTLSLFLDAFGAEASNLALKSMAKGGVYLGGGIAPKILPLLRDGTFMEGFLDKGRFTNLLAEMPIRVILNPDTALLGAALVAQKKRG